MDNGKVVRILELYSKLASGNSIFKSGEALKYGVSERTIQRDIDDIRSFLQNNTSKQGIINSINYDRRENAYKIEQSSEVSITNSEILAICKILLDSRSLPKSIMVDLLDKLINYCVAKSNRKLVKELINNETFHYVEPRHQSNILGILWELGEAINTSTFIEIRYERIKDKKIVNRKLKPLAIMFSEYYFYLIAFIDDNEIKKDFDLINDSFPTIYRIDRIRDLKICEEHFHIPYSNRFEEGEFRKRIQFMTGGKLEHIKFWYIGNDIDAILDRLPTARILCNKEKGYMVEAEVFGKGIDMWIRSQGDLVTLID